MWRSLQGFPLQVDPIFTSRELRGPHQSVVPLFRFLLVIQDRQRPVAEIQRRLFKTSKTSIAKSRSTYLG